MGIEKRQEVLGDVEHFPFLVLSAEFATLAPLTLPPFPGNTLRGAFGWALKRSVCVTHLPQCASCHLFRSCAYAYIFETPRPSNLQGLPRVPFASHPFVLRFQIPKALSPGEVFRLEIHLLGKAVHLFPHVIQALETLARHGLGKQRVPLKLLQVRNHSRVIYAQGQYLSAPEIQTLGQWVQQRLQDLPGPPTELKMQFLTPTRIVHQGTLLRWPTFDGVFWALVRRLSVLNQVHGTGAAWEPSPTLVPLLPQIHLEIEGIQRVRVARFSRRQRQRHELHGFQGVATLSGPLEPFLPLLLAGEPLHIGKSTSFGMGRYQIGR